MKYLIIVIVSALLIACTQQISQEVDQAEVPFTLSHATEQAQTYEGRVELRGYIIEKPFYIDDPIPQFQVIEQDLKKIPEILRNKGYFVIYDEARNRSPKRVIKKLEQYAEENPATIIATKIEVLQEGSPGIIILD